MLLAYPRIVLERTIFRVCRIQACVSFSIHFLFACFLIKSMITCNHEFEEMFY